MARKELKELLRIEKHKYQIAEAGSGGYASGFREWVQTDFEKDPDKYLKEVGHLLNLSCDGVWEGRPISDTDDLFSIDGESLDAEYTFPDETVQGRFRKILTKFASVFHIRDDAILTYGKAEETATAAKKKMSHFQALLKRAGGDAGAFIRDVCDR